MAKSDNLKLKVSNNCSLKTDYVGSHVPVAACTEINSFHGESGMEEDIARRSITSWLLTRHVNHVWQGFNFSYLHWHSLCQKDFSLFLPLETTFAHASQETQLLACECEYEISNITYRSAADDSRAQSCSGSVPGTGGWTINFPSFTR